MSTEYTYYCDGPANTDGIPDHPDDDRCPHHARTTVAPPHMPHGMLRVIEELPGSMTELHFCGWSCVLRYAAKFPSPEIILAGDE